MYCGPRMSHIILLSFHLGKNWINPISIKTTTEDTKKCDRQCIPKWMLNCILQDHWFGRGNPADAPTQSLGDMIWHDHWPMTSFLNLHTSSWGRSSGPGLRHKGRPVNMGRNRQKITVILIYIYVSQETQRKASKISEANRTCQAVILFLFLGENTSTVQ